MALGFDSQCSPTVCSPLCPFVFSLFSHKNDLFIKIKVNFMRKKIIIEVQIHLICLRPRNSTPVTGERKCIFPETRHRRTSLLKKKWREIQIFGFFYFFVAAIFLSTFFGGNLIFGISSQKLKANIFFHTLTCLFSTSS